MRVRVWGCRGSIPSPGAGTVRYGGNTACISVDYETPEGKRLMILDAGSGIRELGNRLLKLGGVVDVDLLISHTHWDHIQGLPFFGPMWKDDTRLRVWGARQNGSGLQDVLRQQMNPVVFPVPLEELSSELTVNHIEDPVLEISGMKVSSMRVRHPGNTLALKLSAGGPEFAYVTDNELGPGGDYGVADNWRSEFIGFLSGSKALVHDAMYTPNDMKRFSGYGHSTWVEAVELAVEAGVGKLILFHHRPEHDDARIDRILADARELAARSPGKLEVIAAHEGLELNI